MISSGLLLLAAIEACATRRAKGLWQQCEPAAEYGGEAAF
jgi:hypothetical protein